MTTAPYSGGVGLAVMLALGEAAMGGADEAEPVHLLLGICKACEMPVADAEPEPAADLAAELAGLRAAFERAGLDTAAFRRRLRALVARPDRSPRADGMPESGAAARELFHRAEELAQERRDDAVGLPHLLAAVLETPSPPWAALAAEMGVADLPGALLPDRTPGGEDRGGASARVAFTVLQGPLRGKTYEFHERTTCIVGRADGCTLQLPEDEQYSGISRHHCLLDINPPDVRVRDLGSANGTYVNGEKIGQRDAGRPPPGADRLLSSERALRDEDEIGLGGIRLRVGIRVPARCATCGKAIGGEQDGDRCVMCRTTRPTSVHETTPGPEPGPASRPAQEPQPGRQPGADGNCAACGSRLAAERTARPAVDELCGACQGDPERVMEQLLQVADDGTRRLHLFGGYTVQRQLGRGGMGAVYLARDHQTDELCALKVMLPRAAGSETARARFLREMSTVEMLRHPHLVRLQDHGCWNGIYFFVMDYCDGGDVAGLVHRRGGRLPDYQAVGITLQVLDGLAYAHQADVRAYDRQGRPLAVRGLVHRDLSLRNIFLDGGVAKVGDFGLAKAFDAAGLSGLTHTGTSAGSPSFVSRQQVLQFKRARPEVDVWSAAACLYYMLTGSTPRDFPAGADRWRVVLDSPAVPIRHRSTEVPERLAKVIDHALTEDPEIGFGSAAEFRRALLEARD
ncbi:protein kinase [Streptomyces sp. B22F1]|uniref:protein kinase domain-containing protein n=1 Tax=Streptomyces sp. B22F1 TaxID=3153566 RepID=UPI00325DF749